ncbi:MAG: GNAT family N-acetyltransferase [Bacillaceae bacterium]|nr:GNAT family N-acetyltransferase [Bacillaceae bacterium]
MKIRRLQDCTLTQAVTAWNRGFEGYDFDMTMSVDAFTARFNREGLSPRYSLVALDQDRPVGILLNGIRMVNGVKTAWNGGTAVDPEYRGKKVGHALMEATLQIYQEENVEQATLEAISRNMPAIRLYEKWGYHVVGQVASFNSGDPLKDQFQHGDSFSVKRGLAREAGYLSFYRYSAPWQNHWESLRDGGETLILCDEENEVGYALYKKVKDPAGQIRK